MPLATRCCLFTMIAIAAGCGARTGLELAQAEGGNGAGGEGGAPPPSCVLTQLAGEIVLAGGEAVPQHAPQLQELFDDIFFSRIALDPDAGQERLGRAVFAWADAWPPSVPFASQLGALCRAYVPYSGLALIADPEGTPFWASTNQTEPLLQLAVGEATPTFFDAASPTMFGGFTIAADSQLYLVRISASFDFYDFRLDWGCGSTAVRASAIPWQDDFLVALTSGTDFGGCGIPGGAAPATRLQIARFTHDLEGDLLYEMDLGRSAHSLTLAPRDGGAWLAVREDGEGAETTIDVYRLDENGAPIAEPTVIDAHGVVSDGKVFDAAPMGERLVVSYRDDATSRLTLQIVEADGRLGANAVLNSADNGESSVLGKDDSVLLAYTTTGTPSQVHVARFECVAP